VPSTDAVRPDPQAHRLHTLGRILAHTPTAMSYGGPHSQEGLYNRNSPPSDGHDILAHGSNEQYYPDDEYEPENPRARRRDTLGSDGSDGIEGERYYDHNGPYDPYGMWPPADFDQNIETG
jgi:1,3-beta-glucan synthase